MAVDRERIVTDREQGQFGLSIGTSLAIEGGLGIHPDHTDRQNAFKRYTHLWVDVRTLFRNLFGSLHTEDQHQVLPTDMANALASEFTVTQAVLREEVGDYFQVVFYHNTYEQCLSHLKGASLKFPSTDKQKIYQTLETATLDHLSDYLEESDYRGFTGKIKGEGRSLILTHRPLDLLSYATFDSLQLLESHTGKIKQRQVWGSKLGNKDPTYPFNLFTLQVFGDGGTVLSPLSIRYRRTIDAIAKKDRWTAITTLDRIKLGIAAVKDKDLRDKFQQLTKNRLY